jgi:prepilin-type N-terminal cleavage/methylation domain-containing protein
MNYIKTNNKWTRQRGTTLIELSVVIAVILLLVGVLFIGIQAWRDGANKSACLVNIASVQKAVRGYQNMHADDPTITQVGISDLVAAKFFGAAPVCPTNGAAYAPTGQVAFPDVGTVFLTCPNGHAPSTAQTASW